MSCAGVNVTGVVAALRSEAGTLAGGRGGLMVRTSGMGCERAAHTAVELVRAGAGALLCWGVAGALDPALRCGDIVLASEVMCEAPLELQVGGMRPASVPTHARLCTSELWRGQLQAALLQQGAVTQGTILTRNEVACEAALKTRLFRETAAVAVDLESAAVGAVASLYGLPFMVVRVIADTAADTLPEVVRTFATPGPKGSPGWRSWLALLCAPGAWPGLLQLARRYRVARHVLQRCGRAPWSGPCTPAQAGAES